jgi:hypothetical protein
VIPVAARGLLLPPTAGGRRSKPNDGAWMAAQAPIKLLFGDEQALPNAPVACRIPSGRRSSWRSGHTAARAGRSGSPGSGQPRRGSRGCEGPGPGPNGAAPDITFGLARVATPQCHLETSLPASRHRRAHRIRVRAPSGHAMCRSAIIARGVGGSNPAMSGCRRPAGTAVMRAASRPQGVGAAPAVHGLSDRNLSRVRA